MDSKIYNEAVPMTGLQGLFTNFDGWVMNFNEACRMRSALPNSPNVQRLPYRNNLINDGSVDGLIFNGTKRPPLIIHHFDPPDNLINYILIHTNNIDSIIMISNKLTKEWFYEAPWGKIALISWGQPHNPPILLVTGYMDTAATFIPLVELLPDTYHYVSFDFPGHGKSDPVYSGPLVTQSIFMETLRLVIEHMQWKSLDILAHSMGFTTSLLYQYLFPNVIKKIVSIDSRLVLSQYYYMSHNFVVFYHYYYGRYYDNYDSFLSSAKPKLYTYDKLIKSVMKSRKLTKELAEILLSRSIVPAGNGLYRITTQQLMGKIVQYPMEEETWRQVIQSTTIPVLNITIEGDYGLSEDESEFYKRIISGANFTNVTVYGIHDLHITEPGVLIPHILKFLRGDGSMQAKL